MKIWNGKKLVLEPVRYVEKLEIDDDARVLLNKNQFEKKHIQMWSSKIYKVINKLGLGYDINDGSGKKILYIRTS